MNRPLSSPISARRRQLLALPLPVWRISLMRCAFGIAGLGAFACQTSPVTSSSSNWVVCVDVADCANVEGAVDCEAGYCVDAAGDPVEKAATGGTSGSGGSTATGGSMSTGASTSTGGEQNLGGVGAAPASGGTGAGGT